MRLAFWTLFALVAMHMMVVDVHGTRASSHARRRPRPSIDAGILSVMPALTTHVQATVSLLWGRQTQAHFTL